MKITNHVSNIDYYRGHGAHAFIICNEEKNEFFTTTVVKFRYEDRHEWWFYPAKLLYVPAVVFDVVTSPIQLVILIYVANSWHMDHKKTSSPRAEPVSKALSLLKKMNLVASG